MSTNSIKKCNQHYWKSDTKDLGPKAVRNDHIGDRLNDSDLQLVGVLTRDSF